MSIYKELALIGSLMSLVGCAPTYDYRIAVVDSFEGKPLSSAHVSVYLEGAIGGNRFLPIRSTSSPTIEGVTDTNGYVDLRLKTEEYNYYYYTVVTHPDYHVAVGTLYPGAATGHFEYCVEDPRLKNEDTPRSKGSIDIRFTSSRRVQIPMLPLLGASRENVGGKER
jgi:hypothetical protein